MKSPKVQMSSLPLMSGSIDDQNPLKHMVTHYREAGAFFNRWNPFSATPNPLTLSEIQARLAYVSSVDSLERASLPLGACICVHPSTLMATLDFRGFDEIYQVGYDYGKEFSND